MAGPLVGVRCRVEGDEIGPVAAGGLDEHAKARGLAANDLSLRRPACVAEFCHTLDVPKRRRGVAVMKSGILVV
jgi:hypothetical protein